MVAIDVEVSFSNLSDAAERLLTAAEAARNRVSCFEFVPSDYRKAWSVVAYLKRICDAGRMQPRSGEAAVDTSLESTPLFCEWGSGMGVVSGLAAILGYRAVGIERDAALAELSRELLASQSLKVTIHSQDMFEPRVAADVYYAYGWAIERQQIEGLFESTAPDNAYLVLCHGQSDLRIYRKS